MRVALPLYLAETPNRRVGVAVLLALLAHVGIIAGVGFRIPQSEAPPTPPTLDVLLVQQAASPQPVERAEYASTVAADGAGNTRERVKPKPASAPPATPESGRRPLANDREAQAPSAPKQLVTARESSRKSASTPTPKPSTRTRPLSADELINTSMAIARLEAQVEERQRIYDSHPRSKHISARTKELLYAAYMDAWVRKVERIGNLNYPDEARRQSLSGTLVLEVALNADGGVRNVALLRSSGQKVLDDAAIRIVRLASPFPPFPSQMKKQIDVLYVTKAWQFLNNNTWAGD